MEGERYRIVLLAKECSGTKECCFCARDRGSRWDVDGELLRGFGVNDVEQECWCGLGCGVHVLCHVENLLIILKKVKKQNTLYNISI